MIQILEGKFKKKFFVGLLVGLVVFGLFGMDLPLVRATESWNPLARWLGVSQEEMDDRFLETQASDLAPYYSNEDDDEKISLSAFLLTTASNILQWTISDKLYNDVFFSPQARMAISVAWKAVRDFVNMFYLLILVFLAITTILQINKFNDKKLFFRVIVSAILVNFSMAITVFVIDASNIVMDFFVVAIKTTANGQDIGAFFLKHSGYANTFAQQPSFTLKKMGIGIVEFIIQIIMAVMLFYTAIALLIRLIAYWVLIVLSPLAFFSLAIPGSNSFQEWKDKLLNYSFFGPMMLLFIWIALVLMAGLRASSDLVQGVAQANGGHFVMFLTSYITVLYLLYYGHEKSKEYASKAGTTVTNILTKGGAVAVKAGKRAALATGVGAVGYAGYKFGERKAKAQYAGFKEWKYKMGLDKRAEEEKLERDKAIAKARWTGGDVQTTKERHEMSEVAKKEKAMKEDGFDMDNRDALAELAENGSAIEKKVAANRLAELNALYGNNLELAMKAAGGNKVLEDKILRQAKSKNRANYIKWAANHYGKDERANKIIDDNLTSLQPADIKNLSKEERYKRAFTEGILSNKSPEEHINIINEETGDRAVEIAKEVAKYHSNKPEKDRLTTKQLDTMILKAMSEGARTELRGIRTRPDNNQQGGQQSNIKIVSGGPGAGDRVREKVVFGPDGRPIRN